MGTPIAWNRHLYQWGSLLGVAAILVLLGPYGTFLSMSLATRAEFWLTAVLGTTLLLRGTRWLLGRWLLPPHWPPLARRLSAAVVAAFPAALGEMELYALLTATHRSSDFIMFYGYTLLLMIVVTLILTPRPRGEAADGLTGDETRSGGTAEAGASNMAASQAAAATFLGRAVPRFATATLLALEADDHYLRVHTDQGSDLILMRLRDAIGELAPVPGLQVHRSFWVAENAVARIARRGQHARLVLSNRMEIPVSRTYMASLRASGWLERYSRPGDEAASSAASTVAHADGERLGAPRQKRMNET